jgi:hypothetical protein
VASGGVVRRVPTFVVRTAARSEVDGVLRATGSVVATYLREPDEEHGPNAWLYVSSDHAYALETLAPAMRRNVRRAMRELAIRPVAAAELLVHGGRAFCDTRRRAGIDDGTPRGFRRYFDFEHGVDRPGWSYLGAWRNGELAAFATVMHVDDWAELSCFSASSMLRYRPNDALMYVALSTLLAERRCRVVSYGLSSIQAPGNVAGLHRFKLKVGFSASRVHRAFDLHPSLRALATPATLSAVRWTVNGVLLARPRSGHLKKLSGMLACMLGGSGMAATGPTDDRYGSAWRHDSTCTT